MNQEERVRLTSAFETLHSQLANFLALRLLVQEVGDDLHKGKLSKLAVQKTVLLLDKYTALEMLLRQGDDGKCPHCGKDHAPYSITLFVDLRKFALECSSESINCNYCVDLGWRHVQTGDCEYARTSDNYPHIEKCRECSILPNNSVAVDLHKNDCNCPYFLGQCQSYNSDSFSPTQYNPIPPSTTLLLKESDQEPMAELVKTAKSAIADNLQTDKFKDVGLKHHDGEKPMILLPEGMEIDTAVYWLSKIKAEQEKEIQIDHAFPGYYPPDAALALHKAIERTWGFASQEGTPGFFRIIPPAMLTIQADIDRTVQVPWGRMTFSGVKGYVDTHIKFVDGMPVMQLAGVIRKGDQDKIEKLVGLIKEILRTESIYRGKAVIIDFSNFSPDDPRFDAMKAPKFMDLQQVNTEDLILSAQVYEMVKTNLFVPVTHTAACRKAKIPLRRGILLAGPFGTGKTLTAQVTAKLATQNGWTYIYITDLKQLPEALAFAKNYGPAVLFGEDIDRVLDGDRNEEMDGYLNSLDGVNRKHDEVLVVFTTNNVDNIHPAMMRPGRIDAIIPIEAPDAAAAMQLLKKYGRGLIDPTANLSDVGRMMAGQIPAVLREVIERSKLRAIRDADGNEPVVTAVHLEQAGREMLAHVHYINPPKTSDAHPLEVLGSAIGNRIQEAMVRRGGSSGGDRLVDLVVRGDGSAAINQLVGDAVEAAKALGNGHSAP